MGRVSTKDAVNLKRDSAADVNRQFERETAGEKRTNFWVGSVNVACLSLKQDGLGSSPNRPTILFPLRILVDYVWL